MRIIPFLVSVLLPLAAVSQPSYTLIGGKEFTITQPPGMCDLKEESQAEAILVEFIRNANVGANDVVKVFADCKQLDDLRAEKRGDITYYGSISVPQLPQKLKMTRAEYIKDARRALKMKEDMLVAAGVARAQEQQQKAMGNMDLSSFGLQDVDFLGEVSSSGNSVQIGTVQTNRTPGQAEPVKVAGVATMSMIQGEQVVVNMHALYEGKKTIKALQAYADAYYNGLIEANEK